MASRIAGITVEIGGDTTKLTGALKNADKSIKSTQTALKDVDKLLKLDPTNTELLSQKQKLLKTAIEETKDRLSTLQEAAKSSDLGADEHDAIQREIAETEQKLKGLENDYKSFGSVAKQQLEAVGQKLRDIGSKVSDVGKKITSFGQSLTTKVTLPLVAVGTAGVASFAEVDKTMQLANKTMNNGTTEAELLNDAMKEAAANSVYGMSDAANATLNFARAGLDAEQAAAALGPAMNLAAGEGGNLDTVSAGLVATINGFHGAFEDAEHYADVFAAACNNSALDVDSLSSAMSVAAPIFSSAGYAVNDAALYMGVMANNGIEADKAANSLKTGIARLVSPAKEGAEKMAELDWSITNADGTMKDSVTIQQELHDKFAQLSEAEQIAAASAIFGKNQMAPWLALINTAPADVQDLSDALSECGGVTQEMATTMMGGFGGSIEKLKSSIDVLVYSLGQALAPTIQKVVDFIQGLVDKFNALSPAQQEQIAKFGLIAAAIGPVVMVVGSLTDGIGKIISRGGDLLTLVAKIPGGVSSVASAFSTLAGKIGPAVSGIGSFITSAGTALAGAVSSAVTAVGGLIASIGTALVGAISSAITAVGSFIAALAPVIAPILAVVAAIAAVVAIGVTLYKHWDEIKAWASEKWNAIKDTVSGAVESAKEKISAAWENVKTKTSEAWENVKSKVSEAWENIKSKVSSKAEEVRSKLSSTWEAVKSKTSEAWDNVRSKVSSAWDNLKSNVSSKAEEVRSKISSAWENVKSNTSSAWESVKSKTSGAWDSIKSSVSDRVTNIANSIRDKFNSAKDTVSNIFNSIKSAIQSKIEGARDVVRGAIDKIKSFFNFSWSLPKIKLPHFSISGSFSLSPPSIPHISVDWYKKAENKAFELDNATIFGMAGGKLLGGGDTSGREVISGEDHLLSMINASVDNALGNRMDSVVKLLERYLPACSDAKVAVPVNMMDAALARNEARRAGAW